nr:MAG TPA: Macroglobulin domain MG4 [Caudoviricetes sp.]
MKSNCLVIRIKYSDYTIKIRVRGSDGSPIRKRLLLI